MKVSESHFFGDWFGFQKLLLSLPIYKIEMSTKKRLNNI